MYVFLMTAIPQSLSILAGLLVFLIVVLILYWFFMNRNNPSARNVDDLPPHNEEHKLQDRYDRGDISEEEYRRQLTELENRSKQQ